MKEDSFAWKMVSKVRLFFLCIKVCGHQYIGLCYCKEYKIAEAKLQRALVRLSVKS